MSRIGIRPVDIPSGVEVEIRDSEVQVKGKNATLNIPLLRGISIVREGDKLIFSPASKTKQVVSNWGTMRALVMGLGFSHPVRFPIPEDVEIKVEKNVITVSGADRARVGNVAAELRSLKKPEPYKGKGMRYSGEVIKIKAGKKAVGSE